MDFDCWFDFPTCLNTIDSYWYVHKSAKSGKRRINIKRRTSNNNDQMYLVHIRFKATKGHGGIFVSWIFFRNSGTLRFLWKVIRNQKLWKRVVNFSYWFYGNFVKNAVLGIKPKTVVRNLMTKDRLEIYSSWGNYEIFLDFCLIAIYNLEKKILASFRNILRFSSTFHQHLLRIKNVEHVSIVYTHCGYGITFKIRKWHYKR